MRILCLLFSVLFLYNCTHINKDIEDAVESTSKNTQIAIINDLKGLRKKLDSIYYKTFDNSSFETKPKLSHFHKVLNQTIEYIDSVNVDIGKYDNNDLKNNKVIKEKFVESPLGDSLFNKLKTTFDLAESVARSKTKRDSINQISKNVLNDFNVKDWKNSFFALNSPSGSIMVLYGFEYELFKASIISVE